MSQVQQQPPKVLIIEDEEGVRSSLSIFLEDYEFEVMEAENGRDGLEMIRSGRPDIVLCDLRMPGMDGFEVLAAVQKIWQDLPVIIISGTSLSDEIEEAVNMGAFSYIVKPILDMAILLDKINEALESRPPGDDGTNQETP